MNSAAGKQMTPREIRLKVVEVMLDGRPRTSKDVAYALGITRNRATRAFTRLGQMGLIRRDDSCGHTAWRIAREGEQ